MADEHSSGADKTHIKAVSSLRSHFENLSVPSSASNAITTMQPAASHGQTASQDKITAPLSTKDFIELTRKSPQRTNPADPPPVSNGSKISAIQKRPPTPPKPRVKSKAALSRPPPPQIDVVSPLSPPRHTEKSTADSLTPQRNVSTLMPLQPGNDSSHGIIPKPFRIPSRSPSPQKRFAGNNAVSHMTQEVVSAQGEAISQNQEDLLEHPRVPPRVNRVGKPQLELKDLPGMSRKSESMLKTSGPTSRANSLRTSPNESPIGSGNITPSREEPPIIPYQSKPISSLSDKPAGPQYSPQRSHHMKAEIRQEVDARNILDAKLLSLDSTNRPHGQSTQGNQDMRPPMLPPRRDTSIIATQSINVPVRKSFEAPSRSSPLSQGFSNASATRPQVSQSGDLAPNVYLREHRQLMLPPKTQTGTRTPPRTSKEYGARMTSGTITPTTAIEKTATPWTDFPDLSHVNRRPPHFREGPRTIPNGYESRAFDILGEFVCTTGPTTRVWSLLTGKLILSMNHGEGVRGTAIRFKPSRNVGDEGNRLWLGTNWGDIHEVDITIRKIVTTNETSHHRHEICGIYCHANDIWTLDSEGKLYVWLPDQTGTPSLESGVFNTRTGRRPSASLVIANRLWLAFGKEFRVLQPTSTLDDQSTEIMHQQLSHLDLGDITAAAVITAHSDLVYFGHSDGKISIYSTQRYECERVITVGLYKVSCLVGIGSNSLWAGYTNGLIVVYDIETSPWIVRKEWRGHSNSVIDLIVDRSSTWRLNRLQILSLGVDNAIGIWDGMLEQDWLENDMHAHDAQFCTFRESSALVVSWNAGACKPTELDYDQANHRFFDELLQNENAPDFVVFGLQELVDLEDKKATAKSFFKSKKANEYGQEQLSRIYRQWRDYLSDCMENCMPTEEYVLLHTASLVGLFTCVFVRAKERHKIRDIQAAEVKTGLGGLHGNKGALLVRFTFEDTSMCFINCHLAAGHTQVTARNNDVATILDNAYLPGRQLPIAQTEVYTGGGNGSLVLDHEICFFQGDLNYRIEGITADNVVHCVKSGELAKLLHHDQLTIQCRKNPAFKLRAFQEAPITFDPTYKYDLGTDTYDSSEKKRVPAWCDRILYRSADKVSVETYKRHEVRVSDHRPVSGRFQLRVKTIMADKRLKCWRESEKRFEAVKQEVSTNAKIEFLQARYGMTAAEARKSLDA